ncbi:hypothetical protein ACOZ38_11810 [Sphaerisporangium viridialbum]|uniref:hypothetical protein n=1 Tax=Sphaerisporangium viridialbum TaxID=46189 RepID=UPI003C76D3D5
MYGPEVRLRVVACATRVPSEGEATWTHTLIAQQLADVGISPSHIGRIRGARDQDDHAPSEGLWSSVTSR